MSFTSSNFSIECWVEKAELFCKATCDKFTINCV